MRLSEETIQSLVGHHATCVLRDYTPGINQIVFAPAVPRAWPLVDMIIAALRERLKSSRIEFSVAINHEQMLDVDYWVTINKPVDIVPSGFNKQRWLYMVESPKEVVILPWDYVPLRAVEIEDKVRAFAVGIDGATSLMQSLNLEFDASNHHTPYRVSKAWREMTKGYHEKIESMATTFDEKCDEMVILKNIEFSSSCEHHMLPFSGFAHVAYIPTDKVIGVSKLARFVDCFAKRLQIQERIGNQVTDALTKVLKPKGAACIIEAKHYCMVCRGVEKQSTSMVTSSLTGVFKKPEVRAELFSLVSMG